MTTLDEVRQKVQSHFPKEPFALDFKRLSDYSIVCKCCHQFYIGKVTLQGHDFFEVWFKPKEGQALCLRQNLPNGTDAKMWASAIASAYKRGNISLKAPPTRQELEAQRQEIDRLRGTA